MQVINAPQGCVILIYRFFTWVLKYLLQSTADHNDSRPGGSIQKTLLNCIRQIFQVTFLSITTKVQFLLFLSHSNHSNKSSQVWYDSTNNSKIFIFYVHFQWQASPLCQGGKTEEPNLPITTQGTKHVT